MDKKLKTVYGKAYTRDVINFLIFTIDCCNYNCNYCYNAIPRTGLKLDLDALCQYFNFLLENTDKKLEVEFIGGEPTLHPQLLDLCKKLNNNRCFMRMYTNMTASLDIYKQFIENDVQLIASWHSTENDSRNKQFIEKLQQLKKHRHYKQQLDIRVMYEIDHTKESLDVFNMLLSSFDSSQIEMSLLVDKHKGLNAGSELYDYSEKQLEDFHAAVDVLNSKKCKREYVFEYFDGTREEKCFNDLFGKNEYSFKRYACDAAMANLYIHFNGDVYPCVDYYTANKVPLFNICKKNYKLFKHPILCELQNCTCDWSIRKTNVFKI